MMRRCAGAVNSDKLSRRAFSLSPSPSVVVGPLDQPAFRGRKNTAEAFDFLAIFCGDFRSARKSRSDGHHAPAIFREERRRQPRQKPLHGGIFRNTNNYFSITFQDYFVLFAYNSRDMTNTRLDHAKVRRQIALLRLWSAYRSF